MAFRILEGYLKVMGGCLIAISCVPEWLVDSRESILLNVQQLWAVLWRERRTFFRHEVLLLGVQPFNIETNSFPILTVVECLIQMAMLLPSIHGYVLAAHPS